MATDTGILQALWSEIKPAVEAREVVMKPLVRLVNRGKAAEAIGRWRETLEAPPSWTAGVWARLGKDLGVDIREASGDVDALRAILWRCVLRQKPASLLNCRLLVDDPAPDAIWLHRHGKWVFYRWAGDRFLGTPLDPVLQAVDGGTADPRALLLRVCVCGVEYGNPKLPPL